jgi:type I restriction-modification system DNA methylase subunit
MAIKKSELYSSLWASCDELRGGMDPANTRTMYCIVVCESMFPINMPMKMRIH